MNEEEIELLKGAAAWLSCEVEGHSEKCTCGSCCAVARVAHLYEKHPAYPRFERIKKRTDAAMEALRGRYEQGS